MNVRKKPHYELLDFVSHLEKPTIATIARCFVGITEEGGNNQGRIVSMFQRIVGDAEGEPWCMSFIQACIAIWESRTGRISPFPATEHCQKAANFARILGLQVPSMKEARHGDIVIWRKIDSTMGHAEILTELSRARGLSDLTCQLFTIGGNTGGADPREGHGVFLKCRVNGELPGFKPPEFYRPV